MKPFPFQSEAINALVHRFATVKELDDQKNIPMKDIYLLKSPTGSGKTLMLVKALDQISKEFSNKYAFIWLTPGTGDLDDQSRIKASKIVTHMQADDMQNLTDALNYGFHADTITFIDWESVNSKKNVAQINGALQDKINIAKNAYGLKFILVIDEEHIAKSTDRSQHVLKEFNAIETFLASATPTINKNTDYFSVPDSIVEQQGLITSDIYINDQLLNQQSNNLNDASALSFLEASDNKRRAIKNAYIKAPDADSNINPLVLIQLPDSSDTKLQPSLKAIIKDLHQIGQDDQHIAVWLSGEKDNLTGITHNHSSINYLIMKHAVSLGWDAPRAKILVTLRLNMKGTFAIQTIGRIRRMPEHHAYKEHLLNSCFIYSNDQDYVIKVLNSKNFEVEQNQLKLKPSVNKDIFGLDSIKPRIRQHNHGGKVAQHFYDTMANQYDLSDNDPIGNEKKLKNAGFNFGNEKVTELKTGHAVNLGQIDDNSLLSVTKSENLDHSPARSFYLNDCLFRLKRDFGLQIPEIKDVLSNIFTNNDHYGKRKPLLNLDYMHFIDFIIINNKQIQQLSDKMHDDFNDADLKNLMDNISDVDVPFYLPNPDAYKQNSKNPYPIELKKNIYQGYNTNYINAKQSHPERLFELAVEKIPEIKWVYRSKDHGGTYFSIPYRAGQDFYPDYLVKSTDGTTYIVEIKGGESYTGSDANIDREAPFKFRALKYYTNHMSQKLCRCPVKFAFVRPRKSGELVYSNTQWKESLDDPNVWKPLNQLFK